MIESTNDQFNQSEEFLIIERSLASSVVHIQVTGDYYEMLNILTKLKRNTKKKEHFEKLYKEEKEIVRKQYGNACTHEEGPPLKDYYAQRPRLIKLSMEKEKNKKRNSNMGIAFISFDSTQQQKQFMKVFNDAIKTMKARNKKNVNL